MPRGTDVVRAYHRPRLAMGVAMCLLMALTSNAHAQKEARPGPNVLIVVDEVPPMAVLGRQLHEQIRARFTIARQEQMPSALSAFGAVFVYIHNQLNEDAERAFIAYAEGGGTLILLHHSISSHKRSNKYWFPFLGVTLPVGDLESGGYQYFDPAVFEAIKLNALGKEAPGATPAFVLEGTEVYINHVLAGPRTFLLGLRWKDPKTGKEYLQHTAGWRRKTGKGEVYYFMAGHRAVDFEDRIYARMLADAVPGHTGRRRTRSD